MGRRFRQVLNPTALRSLSGPPSETWRTGGVGQKQPIDTATVSRIGCVRATQSRAHLLGRVLATAARAQFRG
jgi:hypothetical protein